jgi:hypothetical protein
MPKQSSISDVAQNALRIVEQAIGESLKPTHEKNPAAVALGRLGGLKGGKARASILSFDERRAIARKAANSRWGTQQK